MQYSGGWINTHPVSNTITLKDCFHVLSFDCFEYLRTVLLFIKAENVEFFISLSSLAFTTTLEIQCQSN